MLNNQDIPHIRTVINYDVARDIDTHTHRIGRTGRAGIEGVAYTLMTEKDKEFAGHLVRNLEGANQDVPDDLMKLALQSQWFKKARYKDSQAKKLNFKTGLGYKEKPGLGFGQQSESASSSTNYSNNSSSKSFNPHKATSHSNQSTPKSRLDAMRSQYATQFSSAFRLASDSTPSVGTYHPNTDSSTDRKDNSESSSTFEKPKKKSRWQ